MQNNFRAVKQKTNNFSIIDNAILQDKNLSLKARGLLCFLLQLPPNWHFTEKGLASASGEGLKSLQSGLKELIQHKYLYRFQTRNSTGTGFGAMQYYVFEEPTEMLIEGQTVKTVEETPNQVATTGTYNIDKEHPDYDYFNGGWMYAE